MRILFVEDSERLRRSVSDGLRKSGFAVDTAPDGEEGLHLAKSEAYDVVVLDIMLPKLDGLSLLQRLREEGKDTHVLLLTARDTVHDRVVGLRAGADDYLVKPFAFEELVARVETLARRQNHNKQSRIHVGDLEIDTSAKSVSRNGVPIALRPREYILLEFLAFRRGQVVSRTEIEAHIYDMASDPMSNVVDSAVCALRRKIDPPDGPSLIRTRRGFGYILGDET
ncbi:MAG TPA: response regulator transcription factor [Tepidisphaeraceae bacterium]|nr:response regulator transcription factor [Tepidisphaeraceae bacterium]